MPKVNGNIATPNTTWVIKNNITAFGQVLNYGDFVYDLYAQVLYALPVGAKALDTLSTATTVLV